MANYRDDTQETLVISDVLWGGQASLTEEPLKIIDEVFHRVGGLLVEQLTVSDLTTGSVGYMTVETGTISDTVVDTLHAAVIIEERLGISEAFTHRTRPYPLVEELLISDLVADSVTSLTTEVGRLADEVFGQRHAVQMIEETLKISDFTFQSAKVLVVDNVIVADHLFGRKHSRSDVFETGTLADEVIDSRRSPTFFINETLRVADEITGKLHANQVVIETGEITDTVIHGGFGQAWTTNMKTWATSRYSPYTFTSVVNIDGVLYATGSDGVYALSGGTENMEASLVTGKIDVGQGGLVHPLWSFLEYELDGTAEMDVIQTQSGTLESYTYALPEKPSLKLTSGRFTFGRGLRGRHFSFALRLNGRRAVINDMSVETAQTRRRV